MCIGKFNRAWIYYRDKMAWPRLLCESAMRLPCFQARMSAAAAAAESQSRPHPYSPIWCINDQKTIENNSTYLLAMRPWFGTNTDRDVPENVFLLSLVFVHFSDKPTNLHFHPGTSVPNHSLANKSFIFIPKRNHTVNVKDTLQGFSNFNCITLPFFHCKNTDYARFYGKKIWVNKYCFYFRTIFLSRVILW